MNQIYILNRVSRRLQVQEFVVLICRLQSYYEIHFPPGEVPTALSGTPRRLRPRRSEATATYT